MVGAGLTLILAFTAALAAAAIIASAAGFPAPMPETVARWPIYVLKTTIALSGAALPGAALLIALSEARRVRGLLFWVAASALIGLVGYGFAGPVDGIGPPRASATVLAIGAAAGWVYWRLAGRRAGRFAAELARYRSGGEERW